MAAVIKFPEKFYLGSTYRKTSDGTIAEDDKKAMIQDMEESIGGKYELTITVSEDGKKLNINSPSDELSGSFNIETDNDGNIYLG